MYKPKAELLHQIDELAGYANEVSGTLATLLRDCRAEIERPNIDALIAEIDALPPKLYEISTHPWTEDAYPVDELKAILDKYRGADTPMDAALKSNTARLPEQQTTAATAPPTGR